MVVNPSPT